MLLIQGNKSIGILMMYGNGVKDGVLRLWLHKGQVEQVELLMDIVIDFILLLYMLI
jgi:hypothetical protein